MLRPSPELVILNFSKRCYVQKTDSEATGRRRRSGQTVAVGSPLRLEARSRANPWLRGPYQTLGMTASVSRK